MYKHKLLQRKIAAALAASTLLLSSPALAAENNVFQFDQITITADRITQTVAATPENVTVITSQQLQDKGAKTLTDALTGVSGIVISSYGGLGSKAIPHILGTDRIVVMIDGKRMNLPQGVAGSYGGIDLNSYLISVDTIERIEIVKGGSSTLYGADAVGGVINIITKKGTGATHVDTTLAAGNYGGRSYEITAGGQENKTHWQISGLQESTDGQRVNSASKDKSFSFKLDQDLTKHETLGFSYDYYGNHAGNPGSITFPSTTDYQDVLRHNWSVAYTNEHTDGSRILQYYQNDQTYSGSSWGSAFKHENTVKAFEYQDSARITKNQLLTWGGEWRKDKVVSTAQSNSPDGTTKAIFVQNQISVNDKDTFTLGLRHNDNSQYGQHWLPKIAYLHQANKDTSYFANWGKVFKAPSFDDLYGDDGYGNTGNPNLKAETGWTAELGVKSKLSKATEATLSLFKRDLTNAIKWLPDSTYTYYHPYNINELTSTGIDASLTSKLSAVTTMDFGYTYIDTYKQDNSLYGEPRHTLHLGFNIHQGKLSQSLLSVFTDSSNVDDQKIPSYFVINTNTIYQLDNKTSLFLKVNNLFDRQYQTTKGYPANSRSFLFGVKYSM